MSKIAIVGMGCRFASAPDLQSFWDLSLNGQHAFTRPPADRWDHEAFHSDNARATDKSYAPTGAFIDDIRSFPALALGIPPRRVEVMDPQQRLAIEIALTTIEDGGYTPDDLPHRTGVYMGVTASEFRTLLGLRLSAQLMASGEFGEAPEDIETLANAVANVVPSRPFSAPGALANMIAAAVAQELNLHGPAYTLDAACASALMAIYDAVAQLRSGAVDVAIAGGVYVCLTPLHHIAFSRIGAMSRSGVCRPFDARADGFVQGDGVAAVMLKRLEDAQRDGDRIYATIDGIAINNDGRGDGPMAPVMSGQADVIRLAWEDSQHSPADLGYMETHGTGTSVGDITEFRGLQAALGDEVQDAVLGSSKANIGHTMSAAGVAGLIRAALCCYHGVIPPMANFESAKDELGIEGSGFRLESQPVKWDKPTRLAGVSSFGFGGTNGHAVLGAVDSPAATDLGKPELILLSAPTEQQVRSLAYRTAQAIKQDPRITVQSVARACSIRRPETARIGVVASSRDELILKLEALGTGRNEKLAFIGERTVEPKLAFMYPGQGSQRPGMLRDIRDRYPTVSSSLNQFNDALNGSMSHPLNELLYPEIRAQVPSEDEARAELTETHNCQPALLSCGVALTRLLADFGVEPEVVVGHSLGEFTAAAVGGVIAPEEAARFVAKRGRAMTSLSGDNGAMAAIMADGDTVQELLVDGAVIANINHPRQVVISGATEAVQQVVIRAESADLKAVQLEVSHGFHSPVLQQLDVGPLVEGLSLHEPKLTVASGIAPKPYASASDARGVFMKHAISPVIFTRALEQCQDAGANLFLQVGAGGPLASFARGCLPKTHLGILTLASMDDEDKGTSFLATLAKLWVRGVNIDLSKTAFDGEVASVPPGLMPREDYWCIKDVAQMKLKLDPSKASVRTSAVVEPTKTEPANNIPATDSAVDQILEVVAKVSAYPKAALQTSMSLTEDLGFDSLMVGDLATGIADAFPGLGGIPQELFINNPSVQDLVDYVKTGGGSNLASEEQDDEPLTAFRLGWISAPFPSWDNSGLTAFSGKRIVIAGENHILSTIIGEQLATAGAVISSSPSEPADVIIWTGVDPHADTTSASEDAISSFLQLVGAQAQQKPRVVVVRNPGDHGSAGLGSAARCLSREWEGSVGKEIVIDETLSAELAADRVLNEIFSHDQSGSVRHSNEGRYVRELIATESQERFQATEHDNILITGGTKGIGFKIAKRMAPSGAGLLLVGRNEPSEEVAEFIKSHPRARFVQADVTDATALNSAVKNSLKGDEQVTVLIHSAGVLADGPVETVPAHVGSTARDVKVAGYQNALQCCGDSLKVSVALGSWAGRFGNRHQTHYAAANGQLASLVEANSGKTRCSIVEFGPWSSSEMVATIPAPVRAAMRADGVDFVGDDVGVDAILDAIGGGVSVLVQGRRVPSELRRLVRTETLSTSTHPYLLDHAIDDTPVFPLAAAANNIAFTACIEPPFQLTNLTLYQGITVKDPIEVTTVVDNGRAEIRAGAKQSLAYKGLITKWSGSYNDPGLVPDGTAPKLALNTFYQDVTFHGPLLQGIVSIDGETDESIRGQIRTGSPSEWMSDATLREWSHQEKLDWVIDPLALDSVMQLSGHKAYTKFQRAGTPIGIERLIQFRPLDSDTLTGEVRVGASGGDRFSGDLFLRDANGAIVLVAEGAAAEMRQVNDENTNEEPFEIKEEWVNPSSWSAVKDLKMRIEAVGLMGLRNPYFAVHDGTARDTTSIEGREHINFSSYNYIGLSGDARVASDVHEAVDLFGTSVSASRVASGERPFHGELEAILAECQGCEDALVFTAGHATNVTTIGHLFGPDDLIMHDELIHDSALQGIKLSGAARRGFRHDDPAHLEQQLVELRRHYQKVLIVVEGVYSMDGDICALPDYIEIKKKYGCMLMVDEAHSFGIVGATGKGVAEHYGIHGSEVDLFMGTLSKSLASCGGWISGSKDLITYLRYTAPGFVYSAGITPANAQAALSALKLMLEEPERVLKLQSNAKYFHDCLEGHGLDTGPAQGGSGVIPVITGNSMHAMVLSQRLGDNGINVQPIVFPAVADDAARLRFFLSSTHSESQLKRTADQVANILAEVREEFKLP